MSNYIKKYDVGNIAIDVPYNSHIHELPLLSFSDFENGVNISLVFNKKLKNDDINLFNIGAGYKLNIQKRIIKNNDDITFIDANGKKTELNKNFNSLTETIHNRRYTFNDESKRILRLTSNGFEIEYEDFVKEEYNSNGYITKIYDKYGDVYLSYNYDSNDLLKSVSYNGKVVEFNYSGSELMAMTYAGTTTAFVYDNPDLTISHYTGVSYYITYSDSKYTVKARGNENGSLITYSKECTYSGNDIVLTFKEGTITIDTMTYTFPSSVTGSIISHKQVEAENKKGVKQRIQFKGDKPLCSYEINYDATFDSYNRYSNNVKIYNTLDDKINSSFNGVLKYNDGMRMRKVSNYEYEIGGQSYNSEKGYYLITGWIKSNDSNSNNKILISTAPGAVVDEIYAQPSNISEWSFFACKFLLETNCIYVTADNAISELRDVKVTFQKTHDIDEDSVSHCIYQEGCLINKTSNEFIPFTNFEFVYATEGGHSGVVQVSLSDLLRYYKRKIKYNLYDELYYEDGKKVITDLLRFQVKNIETNVYYNVLDFNIGYKSYNKGHNYLTKFDEVNSYSASLLIINQKENEIYSYQYLNEYFDLVQSEVDDVTTYYTRNKGLITNERIGSLSNIRYTYNNDSLEVQDTYNNNYLGNGVVYHIDPTWGTVYKVEYSDGTVVEDTYDDDKSTILTKTFKKNYDYIVNNYGYKKGLLSSLSNDTLNYNFDHSENKLTKVEKLGNTIEEQTHSNYMTSVYYPNRTNYIYCKDYIYDEYDRLTEIVDELENSYDDYGDKQLKRSDDLIQNTNSRYYYYDNGLLESIDVYKQSTRISSETFTYDEAERVTNKEFIYDSVTNNKVKDVITYEKDEDSPTVDEMVYSNDYYINGSKALNTINSYDSYKRLNSKEHQFTKDYSTKTYSKTYYYSNNRLSQESRNIGGTIKYNYDSCDRISSIQNINHLNSYEYDSFGRLVRENNEALDKTIVYEYNDIGNITSKKEYDFSTSGLSNLRSTKSYTYDTTIKDRLDNYNGTAIPYNVLGCPTTLNGYNLTWNKGKLTGLSKGNLQSGTESYTYSYNAYGQRVSKTYSKMPGTSGLNQFYSGEVTNYIKAYNYDNSGRLISEITTNTYYQEGTGTEEIVYIYDVNTIIGMKYTNGNNSNIYYFDRNVLGDVDAIYDLYGNLKAKYLYDAYGNCTISSETTNQVLARVNPIRYRGYYYDVETGWFWLSSRYYSPELCRFISPDDIEYLDPESVNGLNLYCYCLNNPISYCDPSGHFTILALCISIGVSLLFELYEDWDEGGFGDGSHGWKDYIGAGISGFFGGLSGGVGAQLIFSLAGGFADAALSGDLAKYGFMHTLGNVVISFGISSIAGTAVNRLAAGFKASSLKKLTNNLGNKQLKAMNAVINMGAKAAKAKGGLAKAIMNKSNWIGNIWSNKLTGSIVGSLASSGYNDIIDEYRLYF